MSFKIRVQRNKTSIKGKSFDNSDFWNNFLNSLEDSTSKKLPGNLIAMNQKETAFVVELEPQYRTINVHEASKSNVQRYKYDSEPFELFFPRCLMKCTFGKDNCLWDASLFFVREMKNDAFHSYLGKTLFLPTINNIFEYGRVCLASPRLKASNTIQSKINTGVESIFGSNFNADIPVTVPGDSPFYAKTAKEIFTLWQSMSKEEILKAPWFNTGEHFVSIIYGMNLVSSNQLTIIPDALLKSLEQSCLS